MGSIADTVLEALTAQGRLTPDEELWLLGGLTPDFADDDHAADRDGEEFHDGDREEQP